MPLLPAVIPLVTERRSELVPARLARAVAPLFGIPSERSPFGQITWVCDFNTITLAEISRGAPSPTRAELVELREAPEKPDQPWFLHHRAVVPGTTSTLPNEIVNATMNRYGPHTKSAVLLTAANMLFDPITTAMLDALPLLRGVGGTVHPTHAITGWATVVIETFRSQPALAIAAFKARAIQRTLLAEPLFPRAGRVRKMRLAKSEITGDTSTGKPNPATIPQVLPLLDETLGVLAVRPPRNTQAVIDDDIGAGRMDVNSLRPAVAERMIELLLDAAKPTGIGYVWLSERAPEQVVAEALLPSDTIVGSLLSWLVATQGRLAEAFKEKLTPLRIPEPDEFAGLSELARRVLVLASVGIVRRHRALLGDGISTEELDAELDGIATMIDMLDPGDPVAAVASWRLAIVRFDIIRHDRDADMPAAVRNLRGHVDRGLAMRAAGQLDRGVVADLLSATCIELNAARRDLPEQAAAELDAQVRRLWATFADTLEIDFAALDDNEHGGLGFVIHNYAAYLGAHPDSEADLHESNRLFEDFVIPFRKKLDDRIGAPVAYGRALYMAARTATRLAELAVADNRASYAHELLATMPERLDWVLEQPDFQALLRRPSADTIPFALSVAPALLLTVEQEVHPTPPRALEWVHLLAKAAEDALGSVTNGSAEQSGSHQRVVAIKERLAALRDG